MKHFMIILGILFCINSIFAQFSSEEDYTEGGVVVYKTDNYKSSIGFDIMVSDGSYNWNEAIVIGTSEDKLIAATDYTTVEFSFKYNTLLNDKYIFENYLTIQSFEKTTNFIWQLTQEDISDIAKVFVDGFSYNGAFGLKKYNLKFPLGFSYKNIDLGSTNSFKTSDFFVGIDYEYKIKTLSLYFSGLYSSPSDGLTKNSKYFDGFMTINPQYNTSFGVGYQLYRGNILFYYNYKEYHKDILNGAKINNLDFTYFLNFPRINLDFKVNSGYNFDESFNNHNSLLPRYYYDFAITNNFMKNRLKLKITFINKFYSRSISQDFILNEAIYKNGSTFNDSKYDIIKNIEKDFDNSELKISFDYLF